MKFRWRELEDLIPTLDDDTIRWLCWYTAERCGDWQLNGTASRERMRRQLSSWR